MSSVYFGRHFFLFIFVHMNKLITILGPTASGKTHVAVALADRINGEIISADSRQVYKHMDIGTGKDLSEYHIGNRCIPHHLIDIASPGEKYNLFRYMHDFNQAYHTIVSRVSTPILCGGTGLYLESVIRGYRLSPVPQNPRLRQKLSSKNMDELTELLAYLKKRNHSILHNTTDVDTAQRAIRAIEIELHNFFHPEMDNDVKPMPALVFGISVDREVRRRRITNRLMSRIQEGLIEEVKALLDMGIHPDDLIYYGLEYKFVTEHIIGKYDLNQMIQLLEIAIHQFSKRQMTWFRGMEKRGTMIHWVPEEWPMAEKLRFMTGLIADQG